MSHLPAALAAFALAALPSSPGLRAQAPSAHTVTVSPAQSLDRAAFQDAMRKLWEDHITWTRLYIVSAAAGLPDAKPTAQRLLQNQVDLGNAIKPFFGEAAGERLTALLRPHILIAADLVTAAKAGDTAGVKTASARWYANADEIADFLSAANPTHWPREALRAAMRQHLDLTLKEAQARLASDWAADIAAYDAVHDHILQMADVLSKGIISQFPKQFNR